MGTSFAEIIPSLEQFCRNHSLDLTTDLEFPQRLVEQPTHLDPDFGHLSYGDDPRHGAGLLGLEPRAEQIGFDGEARIVGPTPGMGPRREDGERGGQLGKGRIESGRGCAKRRLKSARNSGRRALAAARVLTVRRRNSLTSRSCSVPQSRSTRPLPCGERACT